MPTDAEIIVKLTADSKRLQADLDKANRKLSKFEKQANTRTKLIKKHFKDMQKSARGFNLALKAAITTLALRKAAKLSDAYTEIDSRLRLVTESAEEFAKAQADVFDIAQKSRQSFSATAELYQRLAQSSDVLRDNQERLAKVTDIVNKAIAAGGTSSQAAQAAIVQLGQGLSAGALRGQEFNSVVEQTPRLAKALADGLGVGIGQLRAMAEQGELTSDTVIRALESQAAAIEDDFSKVGSTISQAFQVLENTFVKVIGGAGQASGAQSELTDAIIDFADALNDPKIAQGINQIAVGAVKAFQGLAEAIATVTNVTKFLAEELSSELFGPAVDDAVRVGERYRELNTEIAELQEQLKKTRSVTARNSLKEDILAAQTELKKLKDARAAYLSLNNKPTSTVNTDSTPTKTTKSSPIAIPESVNKQYEALLNNLRQQAAAQKDASTEAQVRFKIESGLMGNITTQQKELLIAEAQRIDQARTLSDLTEEVESLRIESLTDEVRAVEELQEKYMKLSEAVKSGALSPEEASKIAKGLAEGFEEQQKNLEKSTNMMSRHADKAAKDMESAFAEFLFDPFEGGIKEMGEQFIQIIRRMIAEAAAAQIFESLNISDGNGGAGSAFNAAFGFAGFFAEGGTIPAGQFGIVGENGPELAFAGNKPMTITPNHELGGTQNNININVTGVRDSGDLKRTTQQLARAAGRAIGEANR